MRSTTRTCAVAVGFAALLLVAGCSNGSSGPGAGSTAGTEPELKVGPLSAYFERLAGDQTDEDRNQQAQKAEEIVGACMREQGFEYTPQDMSSSMTTVAEDKDAPAYGTKEFAAKLGYGMTTQMDLGAEDQSAAEQWVDPNADYVATMSETEQQAFYEALYGKGMTVDESDPEAVQEYDWQTAGCQGRGQHEAYDTGINAAASDPAFVSLQEEMNKVWEAVSTDPAMAAMDAEWSRCMADAGFDFATAQAAIDSISARMDTVYNWSSSGESGGTATAAAAPEPDPAAVAELRKAEIDTAVADFACKESTDYVARAQEVQFAAEQAFVDAHRTELDAWADKYSKDGK